MQRLCLYTIKNAKHANVAVILSPQNLAFHLSADAGTKVRDITSSCRYGADGTTITTNIIGGIKPTYMSYNRTVYVEVENPVFVSADKCHWCRPLHDRCEQV